MTHLPANAMKLDSREFFLLGARWAFGFWLAFVGISKWIGGAEGFVMYIANTFAETWIPAALIGITAWLILVLEPVLGLLLIWGRHQRIVWIAVCKLMFVLLVGQTVLQNYQVVAQNWMYFFFALVCASLARSD